MKRAIVILALSILCSAAASAQSLKLSQSVDPDVISSTPPQCGILFHTDTRYIRFYDLAAEGETSPFVTLTGIRYGVFQTFSTAGAGQPIFLNVYAVPRGTTALSGFNLLHSEAVVQPDASGAIFTRTLSSQLVYPNNPAFDLAIELFTPSGQAASNVFRMGANPLGETAPSYIVAPACGFPEPTALSPSLSSFYVLDVCYTAGVVNLDYPGTEDALGDDLSQFFDVNLSGLLTQVTFANQAIAVRAGDNVELTYLSASGSLAGIGQYFAFGSLVTSGTVVPSPFANIFAGGTVILLDGLIDILGLPAKLSLGGSSTNFVIPPGVSGFDLVTQGFVGVGSAANGIFASTNGLTITLN